MICDIHVHAFGFTTPGRANFLCPPDRRGWLLQALLHRSGSPDAAASLPSPLQRLGRDLGQSQLDLAVVLALDRAHHEDGSPDLERTRIAVDNDDVADWVLERPRLRFGASVHPYRLDALTELDRLACRGAGLIKWLPAAQNIAPDDPRCFRFFDKLAELGMPLLTHTGIEHTLPTFAQDLNHPRHLVPALERGVVVIAAHCGARLFLHERCMFADWCRMARAYPTLYGDLGGFGLPLHGQPLRTLLGDPELTGKVVYGSDYPASTMPLWYAPSLGLSRAMALRRIGNPFVRNHRTLQDLGVPECVFSRAASLLRPAPTTAARVPA